MVTKPQPHDRSARASTSYGLYEPSLTSTISSATLPCASLVDGFGCLSVGCLKQAVDLAFLLAEPVLEGLRSVLVLAL